MLYSILVGNQTLLDNTWSVISDEYGNKFLANDSIRQRIRLGKVNADDISVNYTSANVSSYNLPENIFFGNNNKNMNLTMMSYRAVTPDTVSDNIMYITFTNANYRLLSYDSHGNHIISTYRMMDTYFGCAIKFKESEQVMFTAEAFDYVSNRYVTIEIKYGKAGKPVVIKDFIKDKKKVHELNVLMTKMKGKLLHFKYTVEDNRLVTAAYITTKRYKNEVMEMVKDIPNSEVIVYYDDEEEYQDFLKVIGDKLVKPRYRAITLVDVNLPYSFCKDAKCMYLFRYNMEEKQLTCVKSN